MLDKRCRVGWNENVQKAVSQLTLKERARFFQERELLINNGTELKEPHAKHIRGKIWELRYRWNKKYFRVFYFSPEKDLFILLHVITKKSNRTPNDDIDAAERGIREYQEQAKRPNKVVLPDQKSAYIYQNHAS